MGDAVIDRRKDEARRALKHRRASIPEGTRDKIDAAICANVVALDAYVGATCVFTYLSFGSEVNTWPLIRRAWADGKRVAIPRCVPGTRKMSWHVVTSFDDLVPSRFGMHEPDPAASDEIDPAAVEDALAVVPALAFDAAGYRLGYGGGFYDGFLAGFGGWSVGLCRAAQLEDDLRALGLIDAHDRAVDAVVTEGGVASWPDGAIHDVRRKR